MHEPGTLYSIAEDVAEPQRLLALARANRVRSARAELKERLRSGEMVAADVILRGSRETETMTLGRLLVSQPGWGPTRSSAVLESVFLSESKTLGSLTERQRGMLASVLAREGNRTESKNRY